MTTVSDGPETDARERILDGAEACLLGGGFGAKRLMSAIARRAGVSRTTLYKHFDNVEQIRTALMQREFNRFLARAGGLADTATWDSDFFVELAAFMVEHARGNALFQAALRAVPEQILPMLTIQAATVTDQIDAFARPLLQAQIDNGRFPPVDLDTLIDIVSRMVLSLIGTTTSTDIDDPAQLRRYLRNAANLFAFIHAGPPQHSLA
ncbi:MAG TPA: TetR/AcrR family transcriptional regulator [Mycobacterium sp.]|nr:TetR/AcrR family transcriptional regulator [Mycobacterium sp.]